MLSRDWNLKSRIHILNYFPQDAVNCYVKRDDELGSGVSGTKYRKYSSIIPYLIEKKVQHLVIIAGSQSNNLLAALQLARELQMKVTAFILRPWKLVLTGNFKLSNLFLNPQDIMWVERTDWNDVEQRAAEYAQTLTLNSFVLHEGASITKAFAGAMSLADDILRNEKESHLLFQHIFIDAGTGFSAAALIKRLNELNHSAKIHVLLLADDEKTFLQKLKLWGITEAHNMDCFLPTTAKSFGTINQTIRNEISNLAIGEGILTDPVYSAKLFYESRAFILKNRLKGNVLIIHSGNNLALSSLKLNA